MSMFPSLEELEVEQIGHAELRAYVERTCQSLPNTRPELCVKIRTQTEVDISLACTYPPDYPAVLPEIAVRCAKLSRGQHIHLMSDLRTHLSRTCAGDVCVLPTVDWLRDHTHEYLDQENKGATVVSELPCSQTFTRLWIYSHHIYNKSKRKNILDWARELELSGFSMPGKPGIVCVEGLQDTCEEFWARVKVLTWKHIMIRHQEDTPVDLYPSSAESLRRFQGFEEMAFQPHGNRGNHMDLGQLYQFLREHGCAKIFQLYFGVEGK